MDTPSTSESAAPPHEIKSMTGQEACADSLTAHLLLDLLPAIFPTQQEIAAKEQLRTWLEGFAQQIERGSRLLAFGSTASGLALKNAGKSRSILCVGSASAVKLVHTFGNILRRACPAGSHVDFVTRTRIPILKLHIAHPLIGAGIQLDLSFENHAALENTSLIQAYCRVDDRLRPVVMFVKLWAKQRRICSARDGTLSSYTWTILILHYLTNVLQPPLLPNLQHLACLHRAQIPSYESSFITESDILAKYWTQDNNDSIGKIIIGFFEHFHTLYRYGRDVISLSLEGGLYAAVGNGEVPHGSQVQLVIEDPLDRSIIVTRALTTAGLETIRSEFERAGQILIAINSHNIANVVKDLLNIRQTWIVPPKQRNNAQLIK
ncbi:hypothetical protein EMMF5_000996 [Cystobasidiomycetes sp. EMM_F5]